MFFYKLYTEAKKDKNRFVAAWEFVGEMFIKELNTWVLMSYKTPANGAKIYFENPGLIERTTISGKSGSYYYGYRIVGGTDLIADKILIDFYREIKSFEVENIPAQSSLL